MGDFRGIGCWGVSRYWGHAQGDKTGYLDEKGTAPSSRENRPFPFPKNPTGYRVTGISPGLPK